MVVKKVLSLFMTALLAALTVISSADVASATTTLGGVDMQRACNTQYQNLGSRATVTNPTNAYSWRCTTSTAAYGIDVNAACVNQYWPGASAGLRNSVDPYSWYCQGPACYGGNCVHRDPGATDCGGSNGARLATVTAPGGGATIELKWSAYCHANWARWVSGTSSPGYWDYWVQTWDGHTELKTFQSSEWTFMVNGNLLARACIHGIYSSVPACTAWY